MSAKCLLVVFPEPGHFHPFVGVAQALLARGHAVDVFSMEDPSPRLAAAGLDVRAFWCVGAPAVANPTRSRAFAQLLADPYVARRWYARALLATVPAQLEALRRTVAATRPDVIIADPLAYAGAIAATEAGLPWAAVSTQLVSLTPRGWSCPYLDHVDALGERTRELFRAQGVELELGRTGGEAISPWLNTVFATEAFAPREPGNELPVYVGPSTPPRPRGDAPPFPWERLRPDRPLVYASFGTQLTPPPEVYEALGAALPADEADLVLVLNDQVDAPPRLPDHVIAVRYAPQLALLERAAAMVTHGGAGSVAEALSRGRPLCVVPLGHEQPLQAELAVRSGVGVRLAPEEATVERFATALRALLAEGAHRRRAEEVARSYGAAGGSLRVAALIEERLLAKGERGGALR